MKFVTLLMDNYGLGVIMILLFEINILHEKEAWFLLVIKYTGEIQVICLTCSLGLMHLKKKRVCSCFNNGQFLAHVSYTLRTETWAE